MSTKQWLQVEVDNETIMHFLLSFIFSLDFKAVTFFQIAFSVRNIPGVKRQSSFKNISVTFYGRVEISLGKRLEDIN